MLTHLATAVFVGSYVLREYPADGLANAVSPAIFNGRMLLLHTMPHVIVLFLVHLRLRAALKMDALLIRERATAETFRLLYEASQLEPPPRLAEAARQGQAGASEAERGARGVHVPLLL